MLDKNLKYRELKHLLAKHNVVEIKKRGKGSHRIFFHPDINGQPVIYTISCHSESQEIPSYIVRVIRKKFRIPIEKFYKS